LGKKEIETMINIDLQEAIDNEKRLRLLNLKLLDQSKSCHLCVTGKSYCVVHAPRLQLGTPRLKADKVDFGHFSNPAQKERAYKASNILEKTFGSRRWIVATNHRIVKISMWEFKDLGARGIFMVLNEDDWSTEDEFEKQIIKLGGELLERANLLRNYNKREMQVLDKLPQGFEEFMPKKTDPSKWRIVQSVAELEDRIKNHVREVEKNQKADESDGNE
jgi:hypothetical protein